MTSCLHLRLILKASIIVTFKSTAIKQKQQQQQQLSKSSFIENWNQISKKYECMDDSKEKKKWTEAVTAKELMADILGIDFKTIILKMLKELKKMWSKLKTKKQTSKHT